MERTRETSFSNINRYQHALLNQIKASVYTLEAIKSFEQERGIGKSLRAVKETDVFRLRRGLCLLCAAASCINWIKGKRIIGDEDGQLRIGDFYRFLLPFHESKNFRGEEIKRFEQGWLFVAASGNVYHHAIAAVAEALDVLALPVNGFDSIKDFIPLFKQGGALALSLDNKFVIEHTLKRDSRFTRTENGRWKILIEDADGISFRYFEEGRHVVSLLEMTDDGLTTLSDSFQLPQMSVENMIIRLNYKEVDKYLNYSKGGVTRGILFAERRQVLEDWRKISTDVFIPSEVVDTIRKELDLNGTR